MSLQKERRQSLVCSDPLWVIYFFRQITTFIKVRVAFVFELQTFQLNDFPKIFQFKGLKPKDKGHTNFYECCDLKKKVYLAVVVYLVLLLNQK